MFFVVFVSPILALIWSIRGLKSNNPVRRGLVWLGFVWVALMAFLIYGLSGLDLNIH